jgi:hypothetical protein
LDVSRRRLPSDHALPEIQREIGHLAICQEPDRLSDLGFSLTGSEAAFEFLVRRAIQKRWARRP